MYQLHLEPKELAVRNVHMIPLPKDLCSERDMVKIPYPLCRKIYLLGVTSSHMVYTGDACCVVGEDFYMLLTNRIYK